MASLHPQIVSALEAMAKAQLRPVEELTPSEARAQMEATARSRKAEPLPVAGVEERPIPGPAADIPVRLYRPPAVEAGPVPAIAYYHGGLRRTDAKADDLAPAFGRDRHSDYRRDRDNAAAVADFEVGGIKP